MKSGIVIISIALLITLVVFIELQVGGEARKSDRIVNMSSTESATKTDDRSVSEWKAAVPPARDEGAAWTTAKSSEKQDSKAQPGTRGAPVQPQSRDSLEATSFDEAMNDGVDTSVIGRHFDVSAAAKPRCVEAEGGPACDRRHRIEQFADEPRDSPWASRAESMLRSMATEKNPGFSIRNVECRLITCIIEVESTERILSPEIGLKPEDWRMARIKPFGANTGEESSPTGQEVLLTLWIYQRIR